MISFIAFLASATVALLRIFGVDIDDALWWAWLFAAVGFAFRSADIGPAGPKR